MPFIKNNLFLIVLVAATLIVCGVGLAAYFSFDTDVMAKIQQREQLGKTIADLGNRPVNAEIVKTQQAYVAGVKAEYKKVMGVSREINKGGRVMMTMDVPGGKPVALFTTDKKADRAAYSTYGIDFKFGDKYKREMALLLAKLNPVKPPTAEEIAYASGQVTAMMAEEQTVNGAAGTAATSQPTLLLPVGVDPPVPPQYPASGPAAGAATGAISVMPVTPTMPPTMIRPPTPTMITPPMPTSPLLPSMGAMDEVSRRALSNLKFQKANMRGIYATDNSLYVTLLPAGSRAPLDQMWMSLISWWLQQDLVAAILETNQAGGAAGTQPVVPTIAEARIKRLVGVDISPYVGATQTVPGASMGMPSPAAAPTPLLDGLTERTSNADYDVVTYTVRMVMKSSELQAFQRNLQKRNFYTVLSVAMTAVDSTDSPGMPVSPAMSPTSMNPTAMPSGMPSTEVAVPEQNYYYGTDPVMMVTLKVEAIFFTDWERDLMPAEMLGKLQIGWRPEDGTRYTAETASPTGVTP